MLFGRAGPFGQFRPRGRPCPRAGPIRPSSKNEKLAARSSGVEPGERRSDVTTEVQGFTSAGRSPGQPIMALTSDVLPAFTCPIIVTEGSTCASW